MDAFEVSLQIVWKEWVPTSGEAYRTHQFCPPAQYAGTRSSFPLGVVNTTSSSTSLNGSAYAFVDVKVTWMNAFACVTRTSALVTGQIVSVSSSRVPAKSFMHSPSMGLGSQEGARAGPHVERHPQRGPILRPRECLTLAERNRFRAHQFAAQNPQPHLPHVQPLRLIFLDGL